MVLDKNQKTRESRDLEDTLQKNSAKESVVDSEVAYLTHEGMFISDAFGEAELPAGAADSQRNASPSSEPCSSDSVSEPEGTTDSSSSKEHTSSSATPGAVEMM